MDFTSATVGNPVEEAWTASCRRDGGSAEAAGESSCKSFAVDIFQLSDQLMGGNEYERWSEGA